MKLLHSTQASIDAVTRVSESVRLGQATSGNRNSFILFWPGGEGDWRMRGSTWDGATAQLQECPEDENPNTSGNWAAHQSESVDTELTAEGAVRFFAGRGFLRINISGSSGSDAINGHIDSGDGSSEQADGMYIFG